MFAGGVIAYLLSLLLSTFLSNIVSILLMVGIVVVFFAIFGSTLTDAFRKAHDREEELKNKSGVLDREELKELNRIVGDSYDPQRDRALEDYNRHHQDDPMNKEMKK